MKFKSNGIKAKRPLEQIQKTQGAKKKSNFFYLPRGFCMDFLGNQTRMNFPGNQTRMNFPGNQTRMNFPGNRMGDGFSWESNGGCKKNNNYNMIRLVPARIESGRGK